MKSIRRVAVVAVVLVCLCGVAAADPVVHTGVFAGPHHDDAGGAAFFKSKADEIAAGGFTDQTTFSVFESSHTYDPAAPGAGYGAGTGGDVYVVTTVTGLSAGDIVGIDNDYYSRLDQADPYVSFWNQDPYWVEMGDYTHTPSDTIRGWLIYSEKQADDTYTFVATSGLYWLIGGPQSEADDPGELIGAQLRLLRDVTVYTGGTLLNPATSSRGYVYSADGVAGGALVADIGFDKTDLTTVPEPGTLALLGLGAGALALRRRK